MITFLAVAILVAGLATGFRLREHAQASAPAIRHFPDAADFTPGRPSVRPRHWFVAAALVSFSGVVAAIWSAPAVALLITAIATVILATMSWPIHRHARRCAAANAAIDAYAPRLVMPYAGKALAHIGMWSPYVGRAGHPWCVVAATAALLDELAARYDLPMIAGTIPTTAKAALYPHGSTKNKIFLANESVTHVFLGHGDSDKPLSASERVLDYDLVTVAGQAAIDRFTAAGIVLPPERIKIIGRPQTEGITHATGPMSSIQSPTILYAPTWRHADDERNLSSLIVGETIVRALIDRGVTVVFRRHFAGRNHVAAEATIERIYALLERDAAAAGRPHVWGEAASAELPLVDAFNAADAMISDVSGIVVDFMHSEKPFAMYASQVPSGPDLATEFRSTHPTAESAYVIDRDAINLDTILDLMLGPDPLSPSRHDRAAYYLGGPDRPEPAKPFIDLVTELGT